MATFDVTCPECETVATYDGHLPFRDECESCAADLHVCLTCRFHDRFAADECRETSADPVARKDRRNLCEYWKPKAAAGEMTSDDDAKAKLAALFGDAPAVMPATAAPRDTEDVGSKSAADEAKAKLAALFGDKK